MNSAVTAITGIVFFCCALFCAFGMGIEASIMAIILLLVRP